MLHNVGIPQEETGQALTAGKDLFKPRAKRSGEDSVARTSSAPVSSRLKWPGAVKLVKHAAEHATEALAADGVAILSLDTPVASHVIAQAAARFESEFGVALPRKVDRWFRWYSDDRISIVKQCGGKYRIRCPMLFHRYTYVYRKIEVVQGGPCSCGFRINP